MPPLERPERRARVRLPPRVAEVAAETEVLVVGGGPAGLGAALGAAGAGADVVLVERLGFLGGNATAALALPFASFHMEAEPVPPADAAASARLLPTDHGPGEPVVAGALETLLRRLRMLGGAVGPSQATGWTVPVDAERLKLAALDVLDEAGVRCLLHACASGVLGDPPEGVVLETKSGPLVVRAGAIVDCTGDGDVAAAAGARCELGRPEDGLTQPMTLQFQMADVDRDAFAAYVRAHPDQWRGVHGLWDLVARAEAAGELDLPREDLLLFATPRQDEVSVHATRVTRVLGTDVWDLTRAEWESRRQQAQIERFLRARVPGFADAYTAASGATVGVRETRRVLGERVLTGDDVLAGRAFDDAIARGAYPLDIHAPAGRGTRLEHLPPGAAYDVPLGCLVPVVTDRLLVAGRCISATHEAQSSIRVTPIAMATGQAAGVCAALAVRTGCTPRAVDHRAVQRELVAQGASLRPGLGAPA